MSEASVDRERLKAHILHKLSRHQRWGAKHTELVNVRTALPSEYRKMAEEIAEELKKDGFLIWLPKTGQIHVSLNPRKKKEIVELVEKRLGRKIL